MLVWQGLFCAYCQIAPLSGHWKFDNHDPQVAPNLWTPGLRGVIEGGAFALEGKQWVLECNGVDTGMMVGPGADLRWPGQITLSIWFKPRILLNGTLLVGRPNKMQSWTPQCGIVFANQTAVFAFQNRNTKTNKSAKQLMDFCEQIPLETWSHLVVTLDGTNIRTYFNGVQTHQEAQLSLLEDNGEAFYVGHAPRREQPAFAGRVGDLRLYAHSLSAARVRDLFEETKMIDPMAAPRPYPNFGDKTVGVEAHAFGTADIWKTFQTRTFPGLSAYPKEKGPQRRNEFGGWAEGPRETSNGFFRLEKIKDRWWLVDPVGCRYVNMGVAATLPQGWPFLSAATPATLSDPLTLKIFGTKENWAEQTAKLLWSHGFNGESHNGLMQVPLTRKSQLPLPYIFRMTFMQSFGFATKMLEKGKADAGYPKDCIPVFHPDFESFCEAYATNLLPVRQDPFLLGIQSDNELVCPMDLLDLHLALDPGQADQRPGHGAALAWMQTHLGHTNLSGVTRRHRLQFIAYVFAQYYRVVQGAIRKVDPHHLYLGSRLWRSTQFDNPYFMRETAPYLDANSINYYWYWGPNRDQMAAWYQWGGKPVLISEWYAKAQDTGLSNSLEFGAGWLVKTQGDRAKFYQHYTLQLLEEKSCIGWHWLKYRDDPNSRGSGRAGQNKGLVDENYNPYRELFNAAAEINENAYGLIPFFDNRQMPMGSTHE